MRRQLFNSEIVVCTGCGMTNLDGAPEINIPYPVVKSRDDMGDEILCEQCHEDWKRQ